MGSILPAVDVVLCRPGTERGIRSQIAPLPPSSSSVGIRQRKNMHRHEWTDVGALESREPLPEFARPVHELHVRGRESGADVAAERLARPLLPPVHTRGDRLRAHLARGRPAHSLTPPTNHQRQDSFQTERARRGVRAHRDAVERVHARAARPARRAQR